MKTGKKILIFVADQYEDLELHYPRLRFIEAGKEVLIAGTKKDNIYKSKHAYDCKADLSFDDLSVDDFSAVVIPAGNAPDSLRAIPKVLQIIQQFNEQKKLIAFICHGAWVPASAKVLKDIKCTSYFTIKDDVINAGGKWADEKVILDKNFISSRCPSDLPDFCAAILKYLSEN